MDIRDLPFSLKEKHKSRLTAYLHLAQPLLYSSSEWSGRAPFFLARSNTFQENYLANGVDAVPHVIMQATLKGSCVVSCAAEEIEVYSPVPNSFKKHCLDNPISGCLRTTGAHLRTLFCPLRYESYLARLAVQHLGGGTLLWCACSAGCSSLHSRAQLSSAISILQILFPLLEGKSNHNHTSALLFPFIRQILLLSHRNPTLLASKWYFSFCSLYLSSR